MEDDFKDYDEYYFLRQYPDAPDHAELAESMDGMQLAMGSRGVSPEQSRKFERQTAMENIADVGQDLLTVGKGMADIGAATVKGRTQGFIGLPGDIEMIGRGVTEIFNRGGGETKVQAFLRGMQENTILPTTEDIKKWLDKNVGMVGTGDNPYETIGEITAPGGYVKNVKAVAKGVKTAAKEAAPIAGKMVEDYLTKTGVILKMAPDAPPINIPSAPKISTPAFKNWFGNSKIIDDKGAPIVMYHGTKHQFEKFDPKIGYQGAIFFSPKREFAENYMGGTDVREPIAVYVSAKNPFDYDNPKHRQAVIELAIENTPIYKNAPDQAGMRRVLEDALTSKDANWTTIEDTGFQKAIKKLGFDSFYVKESGVKNIGVYDPTQIKSVFNKGTFNPKDPRILYGGGVAGTGAAAKDKEQK